MCVFLYFCRHMDILMFNTSVARTFLFGEDILAVYRNLVVSGHRPGFRVARLC